MYPAIVCFCSSLQINPDYEHTFVFTNDFSALLPDTPAPGIWGH